MFRAFRRRFRSTPGPQDTMTRLDRAALALAKHAPGATASCIAFAARPVARGLGTASNQSRHRPGASGRQQGDSAEVLAGLYLVMRFLQRGFKALAEASR
jgi:hypothetical protein